MKTLRFLLRSTSLAAVLLAPLGLLTAGLSAGLMASIHHGVMQPAPDAAAVLAFAGFGAGRIVAAYLSATLLGNQAARTVAALRREIVGRLIAVPYRLFERVGPGRIHAILSYDVTVLENALSAVPTAVTSAAILLGGALYLAYLSPQLFGTLLPVLAVCWLVFRVAARYANAATERQREVYNRLFTYFRMMIDGAKELKLNAARRDAFVRGPLHDATQELLDGEVAVRARYARAGAVNQLILLAVLGGVVFVLPQGWALRTQVGSGYVLVGLYLMSPLAALVRLWPLYRAAELAMRNLEELGVRLAGVPAEAIADPGARPNGARIELRGVRYRYDDARGFELGPLSLQVARGEIVFLAGGNGSGKTTLGRLLTGLYEPRDGQVLWDGAPVTAENRDLYRQLWSAAFFDLHLFDRLYGVAPEAIERRASELLQRLGLAGAVSLQGDAFSTLELSQGQGKRLGLLATLLEDRPFHLFDEWAAEQDPEWKRAFYRELLPELRAQGKAVVVITHDDRYFDAADRVLHLREGKLEGK